MTRGDVGGASPGDDWEVSAKLYCRGWVRRGAIRRMAKGPRCRLSDYDPSQACSNEQLAGVDLCGRCARVLLAEYRKGRKREPPWLARQFEKLTTKTIAALATLIGTAVAAAAVSTMADGPLDDAIALIAQLVLPLGVCCFLLIFVWLGFRLGLSARPPSKALDEATAQHLEACLPAPQS